MKNIIKQMSTYNQYHTKPITKITHFIGIPFILFAMQFYFSTIHLPFGFTNNLSLAWPILFALIIYYAFLDLTLSALFTLISFPLTYWAQLSTNYFTFYLPLSLFILGWTFQFIGHYFEGKKPALLFNFFQIIIAPLFLMAEICFFFGFRKNLELKIKHYSH